MSSMPYMSAREIIALIASGEITPLEVMEKTLDKIEKVPHCTPLEVWHRFRNNGYNCGFCGFGCNGKKNLIHRVGFS